MGLNPGTRLGPYEILSQLGAGGMGEVYKARDTRLDRTVAVKVLSPRWSSNAEFKQRFDREARAISSLSHPNICPLFDVGHQDGIDFLVMEYLEGESLAQRLQRGPLPANDVLRVGAQIADGLAKAHRSGVVHRDLKPGNVMLTATGAKLLDFGLAKAAAAGAPTSGNLPAFTAAKTVSEPTPSPITQQGTVVGTYQYMSPEQIEGREADPRSDIFALGAVLYEMASGRRAFEGKSQLSVASAILERDPEPLHTIQPLTPPAFEHVVQTCLAKDPEARFQTAQDVALELKWIAQSSGVVAPVAAREQRGTRVLLALAAVLILALAAAVAWLSLRSAPTESFELSLPRPEGAGISAFGHLALSPDGKYAVFLAQGDNLTRALWLRHLDSSSVEPIPNTQDALLPFWSPDSRWIGFFADGKLKKVAVDGGVPQIICDAAPFGGTWNHDGVILLGGDGPIRRVPAGGGTPVAITKVDPKEEAHRWPVFLPDGKHFVFLADANRNEDHALRIASLDGGDVTNLLPGAITDAGFAPPNYLLYVRDGALVAQTLDLKAFRLTGEPKVITNQVATNFGNHHFEFSVSATGLLAFRSANLDIDAAWVDRTGKKLESTGEEGRIGELRLSRDGRQLMTMRLDLNGRSADYWLRDLDRGITSRLTFHPGSDHGAILSPDGKQFVFASALGGAEVLKRAPVSDPTREEALYKAPPGHQLYPTNWSDDGRYLLLDCFCPTTDVWIYRFSDNKAEPLLHSSFTEMSAQFSPDGRWIAYASDESGASRVYVQSFPGLSNRIQVSPGAAESPQWSRDGRELFYLGALGKLHVVAVQESKDALTVGAPRELFTLGLPAYDVSPDGRRLLIGQSKSNVLAAPLTVVIGWQTLLERGRKGR